MRIRDMNLSPEAEREVYRIAHKLAAEAGRKLRAKHAKKKKARRRAS